MKTQIVQLEPHDDYISVRDRMGWGQTTRVLLVWPQRAGILNRRLDLTLIKRYSLALGSQLALVTRNRDVRYQADRLDIPVYKSVREAEQSRWRRPRKRRKSSTHTSLPFISGINREQPDLAALREIAHPATPRWLKNPVVRISVFTLGVLSMLVVTAVFIPSAEISVTPASKTETVTIDVNASSDHENVELSGAVPSNSKSVVVEGRGRTPASGVTLIPKNPATGRVTFVNLTDEEISLPIGTVISTQDEKPIRFSTTQAVMIPTSGNGVTVPVEAILPGGTGNVSAESIVAIEGPLGLNLSVINRRSTTGGTDFTTTTPNEDDYQIVYDQLLTSLQETAQTEFVSNTAPGDVPLSTNPISQQVLDENYIPDAGEPADFLDLSLRVEFHFPFAADGDLYQLGRVVLERHLTQEFTPRPETLEIKQLTQPTIQKDGKSVWRLQASWQMGANLDETEAIAIILGLKPEQALHQLSKQTPIEDDTVIHLTPEWWPRLPVLPFRIKLINLLETTPINK